MATYTRIGQATGELRYAREYLARVPSRAATIRTTSPNTGSACLEVGSPSGSGFGFVVPSGSHTRGGAYFQYPSLGQLADDTLLLMFLCAGIDNYSHAVQFDYDGALVNLIVDNAIVDTATFAEAGFVPDAWLRIGWDFNPADWFTFYAGGNPILAYTGAVSASNVVGVFTGNYSTTGIQNVLYFDDFYIDAVAGAAAPLLPPKKLFFPLSITGNGFYSDFAPAGVGQNYQAVDDPSTPDGDTTHNYSDADGERDTFSVTAFVTPDAAEGMVLRTAAVLVQAVVRRVNVAEAITLKLILYDGLNTLEGQPHTDLGIDYSVIWDRFTEEPDASAWNDDDISGMDYGYRVAL